LGKTGGSLWKSVDTQGSRELPQTNFLGSTTGTWSTRNVREI
jgi:hypothetical protein